MSRPEDWGRLAALLGALALAAPARAQVDAQELQVRIAAPGAGALEQGVLELEVGEPFELELTLLHAPGELPRFEPELKLDAGPYLLDEGWLLVESGAFRPLLGSAAPDGFERSRARLVLARIESPAEPEADGPEPAPLPVPIPRIALGEREFGGPDAAADCAVAVSGLIAPGALTPLPPRGLEALAGWRAPERWTRAWIIAGLAGLAFLGALWTTLRGGAAALAPAPVRVPPLQRLGRGRASIERGAVGEELRGVAFEVSATVREAFDAAAGAGAAGATDAEWIALQRARGLDAELARRLERLFARTERVRFGGRLPTAWGTTEMLDEAERLVDRAPRAFEPRAELEVAG